MSKKSEKAAEKADAIAKLKGFGIVPGTKVYTKVSQVARSGMSRHINVYIVDGDRDIFEISGWVAKAIDVRRDHHTGGLVMSGCGMDMCFQVVYLLGRVLFPEGGPLECSEREHQERRAGEPKEKDGGYLLKKQDL